MRRIIRCLLFMSLFFIFSFNVKAELSLTPLGKSGSFGMSFGGSCNPWNGWKGCYSGRPAAVRVTLVDKDGKKVANTRSVDFAYEDPTLNSDYSKKNDTVYSYYENHSYPSNLDGSALKGPDGNTYTSVDGKNKYKYSDLYSLYNDKVIYVSIPGGPNFTKEDGYLSFRKKIVDRKTFWYYDDGEKRNQKDFLYLFLYYSGYFRNYSDEDPNYSWNRVPALKNYFLVIEPTFFIRYNTTSGGGINSYKYGTSTELAKVIYGSSTNGAKYGLSSRVYKFACSLYTQKVDDSLSTITKNNICDSKRNVVKEGFDESQTQGKKLLDNGYGLGMDVIRLADMVVIGDTNFSFSICDSDKPGIVEFANNAYTNYEFFNNDYFMTIDNDDNSVHCYDYIKYDFSKTIEDLKLTRKTSTSFKPSRGYVTVVRTCLLPDFYDYDIDNDLKNYMKNDITLKIYNNEYKFKFVEEEKSDFYGSLESAYMWDFGYDIGPNGIGAVIWALDLEYELDEITIRKDAAVENGTGSIVFNNMGNTFGKSFSFLNAFMKTGDLNLTVSEFPSTLTLLNDRTKEFVNNNKGNFENASFSCDFNYTVEKSPDNNNIEFRVISLDNPFPARDGTSRIPGVNWLNNENKVFNYITNNRGIRGVTGTNDVSPEAMYTNDNIDPMYSFTLDAGTMAKIRSYNKTHSYFDGIKLKCNDDNRECYSEFLRNSDYFSDNNLTGACVLTYQNDKVRDEFSKLERTFSSESKKLEYWAVVDDTIYNKGEYNVEYDLNRNRFLDTEDSEVLYNIEKNTKFYTCANKTYKSGGPVNYSKGGSD